MHSTFQIYSASAGSGKTFTLAKSFIKRLITASNPLYFSHILAITFTNKAVGEMKSRIIEMLKVFASHTTTTQNPHPMFIQVCEELNITPVALQEKSQRVLKHLVHNYGLFAISTIDGFTHRVIRTFAFDLKLPLQFEVELHQETLLNKAVDNLIANAGVDKALTKVLVDFAIEKADADKSWDITYDFYKIAKLLVSETDLKHLNALRNIALDDFKAFKTQLFNKIEAVALEISTISQQALTRIDDVGIAFNDFSGGYVPKHFLKLAQGQYNVGFEAQWQDNLAQGKPLYPKRVSNATAASIDEMQPILAEAFQHTKQRVFQVRFLKALYKTITPLSLLNAIQSQLQKIKDDERVLLISEFNRIIHNEIKHQPTPFIYERLGEKFRHYFIDEFQDTSVLQWQNLIPLIDNALSSMNASAMLVGDAKQAIYRWRGGEAKQFINLYNGVEHPFQIQATQHHLDTNYRSHQAIVNFNNALFAYVAHQNFSSETHKQLYQDAHQNTNTIEDGYVQISVLEFDNAQDRHQSYCKATLERVQHCIAHGYEYGSMAILVRKRSEGVAIADYLSQHSIPIVSSETLLIKNSPKVQLLNNIIKLIAKPNDLKCKILVLNGIADVLHIDDTHGFFTANLHGTAAQLFKNLEPYNIRLSYNTLLQLSLYEMVETLVRGLQLVDTKTSDAYVQFYLDTVLDFSLKHGTDILGFLEFFETQGNALSIAMPSHLNAISILTIHKSKGLEFPVVIFPYADLDIYKELEPKVWMPIADTISESFKHLLVDYKKDIQQYSEAGRKLYEAHQADLELDNINLLYVALTRAVSCLFIISKKDFNKKGEVNPKTFSGIFISFLMHRELWQNGVDTYEFGQFLKQNPSVAPIKKTPKYHFVSTSRDTHNLNIITNAGYLWHTKQEQAVEYGNLMHLILSKIKTHNDIDVAFEELAAHGRVARVELQQLKTMVVKVVTHPQLKTYFTDGYTIYNEKEIITSKGTYLRPDRINRIGNTVILIDYKTGKKDSKHELQIREYAKALQDMGYKASHKLLVYINQNVDVNRVSA